MSKFNNLNPYRLSGNERVVEVNGPEISELYKWHEQVKAIDPLLAEESQSILETLERGPLFEHHQGLMVTVKEIENVQLWYKALKPSGELAEKIINAFNAAMEGKRRPDLEVLEVKETKVDNEEK
jgi:hypothetical protein